MSDETVFRRTNPTGAMQITVTRNGETIEVLGERVQRVPNRPERIRNTAIAMEDETKQAVNDLIELLDAHPDIPVEVTAFELKEYRTGDPTSQDSEAMGAEISLTCYLSFETEHDDSSRFRVN